MGCDAITTLAIISTTFLLGGGILIAGVYISSFFDARKEKVKRLNRTLAKVGPLQDDLERCQREISELEAVIFREEYSDFTINGQTLKSYPIKINKIEELQDRVEGILHFIETKPILKKKKKK